MDFLFCECYNLLYLPDISKWNTSNAYDIRSIFNNCKSLSSIRDISKWNISNVYFMSQMFINCKSLTSIPDISKCDVGKSQNMMRLFENCHSLSFLPDLSKWNPANYNDYVNDKKHMLNECFSVIKAIFIAVSLNCANPTCFCLEPSILYLL